LQLGKKTKLDLAEIRKLARAGVPDPLRPFYWKILLGYLPLDSTAWEKVLAQHRSNYKEWHTDLIVNPRKEQEKAEAAERERLRKEEENLDFGGLEMLDEADHPLSKSNESQWNTFFKDNDMIFEIEKDVQRTFPHLHFFQIPHEAVEEQEAATRSKGLSGRSNRIAQTGESSMQNPHYQALRSILFMWAKLNPGIAYVQGMNEILGPIYYIFATDPDPIYKQHAEADAFFCFTNLMSEIMNNFCKTLDASEVGIKGLMTKLNSVLKQKDPELWFHLENIQLDPQFYTFRWLTLLLSQEFELPDVLRLWDSLFADEKRFQLLLYVCTAMLVNMRGELLGMQFADALKLLQKYPSTEISHILIIADEIAVSDYKASDFVLPEEKLTIETDTGVLDSIVNVFNSFKFSLR